MTDERRMRALTRTTAIYFGSLAVAFAIILSGLEGAGAGFVFLLLSFLAFASMLIGIGLVARVAAARGKSWIVWGGLAFIAVPFGLLIAWYVLWLGRR